VQNDPKLPGDGGEVPKTERRGCRLNSWWQQVFPCVKSASLLDGNPSSVFPKHTWFKKTNTIINENAPPQISGGVHGITACTNNLRA